MKNLVSFWKSVIAGVGLFAVTVSLNAQIDNFEITIRNVNQTAQNVLEFDVYIIDRDPGQTFELASMQLGLVFNSLISSGGTISGSYDNTGSGLNLSQQFNSVLSIVSPLTGYPDLTLIRLAGQNPPGAGNGTIISSSGNGTLVTHIVLTSSVNFASGTTPDITFCPSTATNPLYATRVSQYQGTTNTALVVTPGSNAIVYENPVLNPPAPVQYNVTGGGSYCEGGAGVPVGLSGSESGVTYTLIRDGSDLTPTHAGTGSPLSFGNQTIAGTYTVRGTNAGGNTAMGGNAVVTVTTLPTVPTAQSGSGATCNQITSNWTAVASATSYQLDVSTSNTFATFVTGYQNRDVGNVTSHNITGLVTGTSYYYRVRAVNSCGISGNSGTITYATLAVPAQPGAISGTASPCPTISGLTYEVAAVTGATSYTWTVPSGWVINSGQGTRTISVTSGTLGGTISVYASNACGDGTARTLAVSVGTNSTAPTGVTITNNNTCNGTSKVLSVTGGSLGTGAVWEWFTGSCGGTSAGTGPSITVDPAAGSSTTYYVRASGACNVTACASGTVVVTGNVTTPSTPVPSATTICQGTPSITVSTSAANATSYTWTVSGTGNTITGTGSTATVNFASSFSGVATIGVSANGCGGPTSIVTTTVTVRPTPTASISGSTSVCQNSPSPLITFSNPQTLPVTVTYNINGSNEANINVAASSSATLVVPTTTATTFTYNLVSVTYQAGPTCSNAISGTATVTINPTPSVSDQTESITTGSTFTVTPVGVPVGTTYTWPAPTYTNGVTGGVAQPTGVSSISGTLSIPSGSGTATYIITPRTGTCVGNTFTLTVTVTSTCEPVVITSDPSDAGICPGGSTTFSVTATGTTPAYQWQYYNGSSWVSVANGTPAGAVYTNATTATLGVSGITAAGSYQYRCNATNCSVSSDQSAAATLTVNALPSQPTVTVTQPTCSTATGTITVTSPTGAGMTYSIDGTTYTNTTGVFASVAPGTYTVTARSSAGCTSPGRSTTVNDQPPTPVVDNQIASINSGQTFTVTPTGVPVGTTYTWPAPTYYNGVTGGVAQPTGVSSISGRLTIPSGSGTATYTVTPATSTCTGTPFTVTVTVNSSCVPVDITTDPVNASMCAGGSASFSVMATGTSPAFQWQYLNGATWVSVANDIPTGATYTNATTTTLGVSGITAAGVYQYRCTATNCSVSSDQSAAATLTVNPVPATPVVGTIIQPTCTVATGSVPLSGLPAGNWIVNPGNITGSASTVTVTGLTHGSYSFTVTNSNGCTSAATVPVVINTQPAVPTEPVIGTVTQPTCAVTTGSVGISGLPSTGNWTLTRNPGAVEVTGSGTTFTVTGIPQGTHTFTVTNVAGCTSPASASITIDAQLPEPSTPVHTVDCTLGFNQAVITVSSPTGTGYEYRLDAGTWQTGTTFSNVANGTHRITVRNSSGCTATGSEFSVNCGCVNPPLLALSATSGSTCGVTAVTITGNTFGGSATSVTITENGGGTVTPASATVSPFSFTYTPVTGDAGRVVVITVTTNNPLGTPCAAATATYSLTVNANPTAPVPGTVTHPSCALPTGSVVLNSLPATGDWIVTRNPGGQTTNGSGTSTTISGLAPGTYNFTVTNSNGCVSVASSNVVIIAQPDTPTAPVVGAITQPSCALSTGSVALSGLPASGNWTLTRNPGNITIPGSGSTKTVSAIPPGTYTFTVANAAGCISPASADVVINPQPVTPPAPVIGTITHPTCELGTGSIVLENMPETGEWTLIRYPGASTSTGTGSSATISSLPAGTYNFAVRNADGCTSPVSANAVINAQPPTPTSPVVGTVTHPTPQVATGSVVLSGLPASGTWTLIRYPDGFASQGTGTTRTVSGLEPGTYTFAVTNSFRCTSAPTGDVVINARPGAPVVVINNPPTICENETTDLTDPAVTAGSDPNLTFTYWTDTQATEEYTTPSAAPAGTYYIRGTSTSGYYTIKPVVVTADQLPIANAGQDTVLYYLFSTTLHAKIPEIGTGLWALVSGTGNISNAAAPSTSVSGLSVGENIFSWTVTNGACEPVTDEVVIRVNNLTIPTLITPNEDGLNDFFKILGLETLGRTELTIFDRRGMKVYENDDYTNEQSDRWEGLDYNSNPLPDDTYFYVIRAANGVSISGYIVVRR